MAKEKNRKKIYDLDERSLQVKEILGQAPNWVINWGISLLLIIVVSLIIGSSLISYNDIIPARVTITTKTPPAYIEAKSSGKLVSIFIKPNQFINKGEVLAIIENTANFEDVMIIKNVISKFKVDLTEFDSINKKYPSDLNLGTIQDSYNDFRIQYQNYLSHYTLKQEKIEVTNLRLQYQNQFSIIQQRKNQLEYDELELKVSLNQFNDFKNLYNKGVISKHEFLNHEKQYLSNKKSHENIIASIRSAENSLNSISNSISKVSIDGKTSILIIKENLYHSIQNLKNNILEWEQLNILKSPIDGKVTVFDIRSKYQNVKLGDVIFTIVPKEIDSLIGYATTPINNSGKIKIGQTVIIKLDNYPFQEWGSITGMIRNISSVPKKDQYYVNIDINKLKTSYGKTLEFKQEMQGTAEIITEELSILTRIFYQSRKIFNR